MDIEKANITSDFLKKCKIDECVNNFAAACELYSAVLDINGGLMIEPTGPSPYLGEFYVTIDDPKYHELYLGIVNNIISSREAMYSEIDDGNPESRIAAAPIFVNGAFVATWVLYAHNAVQNQKLFKSFDKFNAMAASLSDILTMLYNGSVTMSEDLEVRAELEFERQCKEFTEELLDKLSGSGDSSLTDIYERVGRLLDVDYVVYYSVDEKIPGHMFLEDYWAKEGKGEAAVKVFDWEQDHYSFEIAKQIRNDCLIIDKNNMTNQMRVEVFNGKAKAVMVYPVYLDGKYHGRFVFIENTKERVWTNAEKKFARQITEFASRQFSASVRLNEFEAIWHVIRDTFEILPSMIMVRKAADGKVVFANEAFRRAFGEELIGTDINHLIPLRETIYEGVSLENSSDKINYQRYIDGLGGIYEVTESFVNWGAYGSVSVVILNPTR